MRLSSVYTVYTFSESIRENFCIHFRIHRPYKTFFHKVYTLYTFYIFLLYYIILISLFYYYYYIIALFIELTFFNGLKWDLNDIFVLNWYISPLIRVNFDVYDFVYTTSVYDFVYDF